MSDASARDRLDNFSELNEKPTSIRHLVVGIATSMSILLYLDRFCVSFAERYIREELNLSNEQMSLFLGIFFATYAIAQVPSGWLSDRFGPRAMLCLYILAWSIFTGGMGLVNGFVMLLVMRAGCGLAQAGAYPSCGTLLSRWSPLSSRARASSLVALGGRIGGAIAPLLTAFLMVMFVPVSRSSLFTDAELLRPISLAHHLAERIEIHVETKGTESIVTEIPRPDWEHVAGLLTSEQKAVIESIAENPIPESPENASRVNETLSPEQQSALLSVINGLLARDDFYDQEAYRELSFSREANYLIDNKSGRSLTGEELTRRNRLVAEAVFPDALGKLYVHGWRPVMITYGLIGIFVAAAVWLVYRDDPAQHPWCNAAERRLIKGILPGGESASETFSAAESKSSGSTAIPWRAVLRSTSIWCSSLSQFMINVGWLFIVTWFPRYLAEVHHVPIEERSLMSSLPMWCGMGGLFLGGLITDFLTRKIGLRWGRGIPITVSKLFSVAAFLSCIWLDSPWAVTAAMACVAFSTDLGIAGLWAFCQDVGGRHVGTVLGFGNMWGNFGAAISPMLLNAIVEHYSWNGLFAVCAAAYAISGIASLGIDCTKPIVPDEAVENDE
ncbi:MAG: MFS transporter [Planctomycetaceae bacterium]